MIAGQMFLISPNTAQSFVGYVAFTNVLEALNSITSIHYLVLPLLNPI